MSSRLNGRFMTVRTEGGILPSDLLLRIAAGDDSLGGVDPLSYHLAKSERLGEAITRAWTRVHGAWQSFRAAAQQLAPSDLGTGLTRERWLGVLAQELHYGRLPVARSLVVDGKPYPISHMWDRMPIHLVGFRVDLDRRTAGVAGAARVSPHGLVQEYLNRSGSSLWGVVSNGLRLRLLRDNVALTRQAYVEFDLEAMMEGQAYSDFALLWLLCHQSRFEADDPTDMWIEKWSQIGREQGSRALEDLKDGIRSALETLGTGFLSHGANVDLRQKLRGGGLSRFEYRNQLLRLVYRLIFLFVAEDRELLHPVGADPQAVIRYGLHYSTYRLRRLSQHRRGSRHSDLYRSLQVVMNGLGSIAGLRQLALPALGGDLWAQDSLPDLATADIANAGLLKAVRALSFVVRDGVTMAVDYRNIGAEEIGGVYESLLELIPEVTDDATGFELSMAPGNERKTSGSYYTHPDLVQSLLDTALDPVLAEAMKKPDPEKAILALKVCDPACGSGAFLIAAAHRMAKRLATVRTGDDEPSPDAVRSALRDTVGHCLYGVDMNPLAVELCKVNLWMEAMDKGKPLSFLDHRIMLGNSLLGTAPALMAEGIPDEAFAPLEGDDKTIGSLLRKRNREERDTETMFLVAEGDISGRPIAVYDTEQFGSAIEQLDAMDDNQMVSIEQKRWRYRAMSGSREYGAARLAADAWCAAFVWRKVKGAPAAVTRDVFRRINEDPQSVPGEIIEEVRRIAEQHSFFHWHIAYPDVFHLPAPGDDPDNELMGWSGGFDVVLGNPPWERIKIQEKEWFAARDPAIAGAPTAAARRRLIQQLRDEDRRLYDLFAHDLRQASGESHFVRNSGRYPLCGRGDINTYTVFAETMRNLISSRGRVGVVIPSGIATDDTTKVFFQDIMEKHSLVSLYDFENRKGIFPAIDSRIKFSLVTMVGSDSATPKPADFVFFALRAGDLKDPDKHISMGIDDLRLMNPNTLTTPIFRSRRDYEVTRKIYERVPVLIREKRGRRPEENPWGLKFMTMFHMTNDSGLFRTREQLEDDGWELNGNAFERAGEEYLPLYEAKMVHQFDHRWATYDGDKARDCTSEEKSDPYFVAMPRYWVPEIEINARLAGKWDKKWLLGWRDICRSTDERTVIADAIPLAGVGNTFPLILSSIAADDRLVCLVANLCSLALDFCARQKIGGTHVNYHHLEQLPTLAPCAYERAAPWDPESVLLDWIGVRASRLLMTTHDMLATDLNTRGLIEPVIWDDESRLRVRCELDAAFFHLYGLERADVEHVFSAFPGLRENEMRRHREFRTERLVLEYYDAMAEANSPESARKHPANASTGR
jgi:hypothetical protein